MAVTSLQELIKTCQEEAINSLVSGKAGLGQIIKDVCVDAFVLGREREQEVAAKTTESAATIPYEIQEFLYSLHEAHLGRGPLWVKHYDSPNQIEDILDDTGQKAYDLLAKHCPSAISSRERNAIYTPAKPLP